MRRAHHERDPQAIYRICVEGMLDDDWGEWLGGMAVDVGAGGGSPTTTLTGPVRDQTCLRGLLNRLWDLNLTIISVARLTPDTVPATKEMDGTTCH